ncbi:TRAP transporter large permease [Pseudovibrio sp. Tun.PSC04-5.I4]|uniref:TRAP transporter large permease n=1 Tax=Pseudovibrio sp. Tun.PSC04-5.I4 TaxID=1798213 RepID=UPI0008926482|nr:TRAP transporter large permease [Pseudovibrio sp. Tun.PSC04-5.I4]SDR48073.1 TRAP transporter, DctM subunit [Pseudovibrio sp. Tun.PSC04-5.I4]
MEALLLLGILFGLIFLRMPVPFAMLAASAIFIIIQQIAGTSPLFSVVGLKIIAQRVTPSLESFPLLAIPLFVFAGNLLNVSGIADRIFAFAKTLVAHVHGGLAHVNILASIVFSGMSGVAQADAAGLGTIEIKAMEDAGFDKAFSAAVTATSSIIGPIIPPSVIMVIYAVLSGESIARLFLAGIVPGLFLGFVLMVLIYFMAVTGKIHSPVVPRATFREIMVAGWRALPGLLAPILLVTGLLMGVATPTELGAIVTVYALILGTVSREMSFQDVLDAMRSTTFTIGAMVFIIACAAPISWLISILNVPETLQYALLAISDNPIVLLLMINVMLLIAGLFMETTAILLIGVPTLLPLVQTIGMDPTQFGVMMIFNLLIGAISPPFGVILFIMMDIAKISYAKLIKAMMPFYLPILVTLIVITFVPAITLSLPDLVAGSR